MCAGGSIAAKENGAPGVTPEVFSRLFAAYVAWCEGAGMEPRVDLFLSRCREIFGRRRGAPRVGENEAREIARLREAGLTLGEVGRILNRPESTVRCVELRAKRNLASGFARSCNLARTGGSGGGGTARKA